MTNINISDKGRAFLKKAGAATQLASAIVSKKNGELASEGITVKIDARTSVTVKSAAAYATEPEMM